MDPSSSSQTRLQKQAPPALHIQLSPADASPAPIPLLSPVSVPPPPPQFAGGQQQQQQVPVAGAGGWQQQLQHPVAVSSDQAQLASMFRSQCSLGDPAQNAGFGGAQARTFG